MCGLAGIFSFNSKMPENSLRILRKMQNAIKHRGPDDLGESIHKHCGFAFCRLSIIDIEHGHQPMISISKSTVIVFNGEIYNFMELRKELENQGSKFQTNSDTEVILNGYEAWGLDVIHKLRGMFAFAIYDIAKNHLFVARDHTGIKPFYYSVHSGNFVFASEIKAIKQFPDLPISLNADALPKFLSFLWVPPPETLFENIFTLEPGHFLVVNENGIKKKRYWNPDLVHTNSSLSEDDWADALDFDLRRVVEEQMISDVPLGSFLSGGLDSSTIVYFMNQVSRDPIITYTTGFSREDIAKDVFPSEIKYARLAASLLNVKYNEIIMRPDVVDLLPSLVWHMDEPLPDPAAVTTYFICKAAKEKCSVMLSGVGGDEIFGGYPRYVANYAAERYQKTPRLLRKHLIKPIIERIPTGSVALIRNLKKFIRYADMPFEQRYLGFLSYYTEDELTDLLRDTFSWSDVFARHRHILKNYKCSNVLQTMLNLDLMTFLPNLNLMYTDKMSSALAVEVRVPFLDHLLIEKVAMMPDSLKINGIKRKYILKKVSERYLPHKLVWRKKAGFGAPIGAWLKGQLREMMLDLLSEETIKKRGYFNSTVVSSYITDHLKGKEYYANQLWQLMMFELWHQQFID
ncbi:asparagine synthase (glutamine-hydrolyzing) [Acidobacteriota bacterium]